MTELDPREAAVSQLPEALTAIDLTIAAEAGRMVLELDDLHASTDRLALATFNAARLAALVLPPPPEGMQTLELTKEGLEEQFPAEWLTPAYALTDVFIPPSNTVVSHVLMLPTEGQSIRLRVTATRPFESNGPYGQIPGSELRMIAYRYVRAPEQGDSSADSALDVRYQGSRLLMYSREEARLEFGPFVPVTVESVADARQKQRRVIDVFRQIRAGLEQPYESLL